MLCKNIRRYSLALFRISYLNYNSVYRKASTKPITTDKIVSSEHLFSGQVSEVLLYCPLKPVPSLVAFL